MEGRPASHPLPFFPSPRTTAHLPVHGTTPTTGSGSSRETVGIARRATR